MSLQLEAPNDNFDVFRYFYLEKRRDNGNMENKAQDIDKRNKTKTLYNKIQHNTTKYNKIKMRENPRARED